MDTPNALNPAMIATMPPADEINSMDFAPDEELAQDLDRTLRRLARSVEDEAKALAFSRAWISRVAEGILVRIELRTGAASFEGTGTAAQARIALAEAEWCVREQLAVHRSRSS